MSSAVSAERTHCRVSERRGTVVPQEPPPSTTTRGSRRAAVMPATLLGRPACSLPVHELQTEGMRTVVQILGVLLGIVGIVVAAFGVLFALQGFGVVLGSPMSNTTTWSVLGPIIALVGIALAFAGWRLRKS